MIQPSCIIPTPDCPNPAPDPSDTQISADVTYSSTYTATLNDYFTDPVTGQYTNVMTVSPVPASVHVEAGYLWNGAVRVTTSYSDGVDPATAAMPQITSEDLTGDDLTDVNTYGYSLQTSTPDSMQAQPAMDLVGSTANGDITAGFLVSSSDTLVSSQSVSPANDPSIAVRSSMAPVSSTGSAPDIPPGLAFARVARGAALSFRLHGVNVHAHSAGAGSIIVEDDLTGPGLGTASIAVAALDPSVEKHSRKFKRTHDDWVLEEDRSESNVSDSHGRKRTVTVAGFKNVKFHRNAKRDAERHALRPTTDWIPRAQGPAAPQGHSFSSTLTSPAARQSSSTLSAPTSANRLVVCGDECAGGGYTPTNPSPTGGDPLCLNDVVANVNPLPASVNILYQHGIASSARTWCQMSRYVREKLRVGNEIRHTLDSHASYENQAADLEVRFRNDAVSYPGPYVLVGHSNGGLVNRYMAQQVRDPSLVLGVVSLSSPHAGAYLANTSERVLIGILAVPVSGYFMGCDIANAYVCTHGNSLATQVILVLSPFLVSAAFPVLQEMGTNAPFHNTINARGDASYRVAGVTNRVWDRWSMWRLLADSQRCPDGFVDCDQYSRWYVNAVDKNYHHFIKCAVVSGLLGIVFSGARRTAVVCAKNAAFLRVSDAAYKRLSVANGHGDGVVPEFSQKYPGAPSSLQFLVDDSDSHVGETRSRRTSVGVLNAINLGMRVPFDQ